MKRRDILQYSGTVGLSITTLAGCLSGTSASNEVVVGTAPGFPPFEMRKDGELVGFDIDLLEAVIVKTDYSLREWKTFDFDGLIPALTNGNIEIIAAAMSKYPDRDKKIDFTNTYYQGRGAFLVRDDSSISISEFSDISEYTVGAQRGTGGAKRIGKKLIEPGHLDRDNYIKYDSYLLALKDLKKGRIDVLEVQYSVAQSFVQEHDVKIAHVYDYESPGMGFGVREQDDDLKASLNEGLEVVRENGTHDELLLKWFSDGTSDND